MTMEDGGTNASVRVRLNERLHFDMGVRAKEMGQRRDIYCAHVLRYGLIERSIVAEAGAEKAMAALGGNELFIQTIITQPFRTRLEEESEKAALNIASYCGRVIEAYLKRFERDPRDFLLLPSLDMVLEVAESISSEELKNLVRENLPSQGVKAGYLGNWLFSRLRLRVDKVMQGGKEVPLTPGLITEWLK